MANAPSGAKNATDYITRHHSDLEVVILCFYSVTIALSICFNCIALVIIHHQKELHDYMKILYQILAMSNFVLSISWSVWSILWQLSANKQTCTVISMTLPVVYYTSLSSVMICLCGISLNLYLLVTKPLRYHTILTRKRFLFSLASMYLLNFVAQGIYLPFPNSPFIRDIIGNCLGREISSWTTAVDKFYTVFPVCVTLIFTTLIYVRLLIIVRQKTKAVVNNLRIVRLNSTVTEVGTENGVGGGCQELNHPQNRVGVNPDENLNRPPQVRLKGLITVIFITGSFYIVWIPYIILYTGSDFIPILDLVAGSSTWVQPIIYLLTNPEARKLCSKSVSFNK